MATQKKLVTLYDGSQQEIWVNEDGTIPYVFRDANGHGVSVDVPEGEDPFDWAVSNPQSSIYGSTLAGKLSSGGYTIDSIGNIDPATGQRNGALAEGVKNIKTIKVKTPDGTTHNVIEGSKAHEKYLDQIKEGETAAAKKEEERKVAGTSFFTPDSKLPYDQALANLRKGGLTGTALANAEASLKKSYESSGSGGGSSSASATQDKAFSELLAGADLSSDQSDMLQAIYDSIAAGDADYADKLSKAIDQATAYADPYFKAQARLVKDALSRGLQEKDDDLEFQEQQLSNTLRDLQSDIELAGNNLSLDEIQEMKALEREYEVTLDNTRTDLASLGKTSSSVRAQKEQFLNESFGDLRESKTRSYATQRTELENKLNRGERDTAAEVERLRKLTESGKLDLLRSAEEQVGSDALKGYRRLGLLGDITGSQEYQKASEVANLARTFVF